MEIDESNTELNEKCLVDARAYQMAYTRISVLATLRDDLSRLNRKKIVEGVAAVQQADGSFSACIVGVENDMRFVFCAAAICHMLDYLGDGSNIEKFLFNFTWLKCKKLKYF